MDETPPETPCGTAGPNTGRNLHTIDVFRLKEQALLLKPTTKQLGERLPSVLSTQGSIPTKRLIRDNWFGKQLVVANLSY